MKKIITIIICAVCLISCTKEGTTTVTPVTPVTPPAPNPGNPAAGSFTWKENGVAYTADSAWFHSYGRMFAHASAGANKRLISISFTVSTGVYPLPNFGYSIGGASPFNATAGILTITTVDTTNNNRLTGTFTNITAGSYTLTDGVITNLPKR